MSKKLKILVTGAAGFLGSHLSEKLALLGHEVVGIDSMIGGYEDNVPKNITFHKMDCCDLKSVQRIWVKSRDDKCAFLDDDAVIMDLKCAINMTASSLWYLFEIEKRPLARKELILDYKAFTSE